jgi:hypothetical protein
MVNDVDLTTPEIKPGVIWRIVDENAVVVSPDTGDVHVLSQTGAIIWQMLANKNEVRDIESYLVAHYIVSAEQASQDVAAFIRELKDSGLLK